MIVWLIEWKPFEVFIILIILCNSIVIAMYDQMDKNSLGLYNQALDKIQFGMSSVFAVEASLRVIGMGFIVHKNAYLRDPWNWLDFFSVIVGILELNPNLPRLKFFRTLRILKPLRTFRALPSLKRLLNSLLRSLKTLVHVVIFMLFFMMLFGIIGVAMFKGKDYNRCFLTQEPQIQGESEVWMVDYSQERICSKQVTAGYQCNEGTYCGNPFDYNLPLDGELYLADQSSFGLYSFNNLGIAVQTIFQILTLEGWVDMMHNMQDAGQYYQSPIYFILIVIFGGFFLMNLILAAIMDSFEKVDKEMEVEEMSREFKEVELKAQRTMQIFERQKSINPSNFFLKQSEGSPPVPLSKQQVSIQPQVGAQQSDSIFTEFHDEEQKREEELVESEQLSDGSPVVRLPQENILVESLNESANPKESNREYDADKTMKELLGFESDEEESEVSFKEVHNLHGIRRLSLAIVTNSYFSALIITTIIANTVVLFMDRYPIEDDEVARQELANTVFYGVFIFELIVKLVGLGFHRYFDDRFNVFDLCVLLLSTVDLILSSQPGINIGRLLVGFRALRFLRIFKLARKWKSLQDTLTKLSRSFKEMLYFLILLVLFIFVYGLLGMELYSNLIKFDPITGFPIPCQEDDLQDCAQKGQSPRVNFDTLENAVVAVLILIVGDNWNEIMSDYVRATSMSTTVFFITLEIFGNIILLNLFLAILLRQFEDIEGSDAQDSFEKSQYQELLDYSKGKLSLLASRLSTVFYRQKVVKIQGEVDKKEVSEESSIEEDMTYKNHDKGTTIQQDENLNLGLEENTRIVNRSEMGTRLDIAPVIMEKAAARSRVSLKQRKLKGEQHTSKHEASLNQSFTKVDQSNRLRGSMRKHKTMDIQSEKLQEEDHKISAAVSNLPQKNSKTIASRRSTINIYHHQQSNVQSTIQGLQGTSFFLFGPRNKFRLVCALISRNQYFKNFISLLVILSTVNLALTNPLHDQESDSEQALRTMDIILSSIFGIECMLVLISRGVIINGPHSYMRDRWRILDFIVIFLSLLSLVTTGDIKVAKVLRNFRVLRPLRLIPRNYGLKVALQSLVNSVKGLFNVTIIGIFMFFIWGIFGVNFFKGLSYICFVDQLPKQEFEGLITGMQTKWDCENIGGHWRHLRNTFDDVLGAVFSLYQISTTEGWLDEMLQYVDSSNYDMVPKQDASKTSIIYFVLFIFLGGLFTLNLFQGVVISAYLKEKEKLTNSHKLTQMQREWMEVQIKCYKSRPLVKIPKMDSRFRQHLVQIIRHDAFELTIYLCIVANTVVLACNWYGMPASQEQVLNTVNQAFTIIFSFEAVLKIAALGRLYFRKAWNLFDFAILILTFVQIVYSLGNFNIEVIMYVTILRVLKLLKTARLFKKANSIKNIAKTLLLTFPNLTNIALLLFAIMVFYSILGMNIFGKVKINGAMSDLVNFQSFDKAFLAVFQCSTEEGWKSIMQSLMKSKSPDYQCIVSPTQEQVDAAGANGIECGNNAYSLIFFLSYNIIVCQIFLNLFIAIILDGFDDSKQQQNTRIDDQMVKLFQKEWAKHDPEGTGLISVQAFEETIVSLITMNSKWIRGGEILLANRKQLLNFVSVMELPMYNNFTQFHYYDVLTRLSLTILKVDFECFLLDQETAEEDNILPGLLAGQQSTQSDDEAMMKWMQVKDHLLFESFEDFYEDLMLRLSQDGKRITLNTDLVKVREARTAGIDERLRCGYSSQIMKYLGKVVHQMRLLVASMKERRAILDPLIVEEEVQAELRYIKAHFSRTIDEVKIKKKTEDFFQILAKHFKQVSDEEAQLALRRSYLVVNPESVHSGGDAENLTPKFVVAHTPNGSTEKSKFYHQKQRQQQDSTNHRQVDSSKNVTSFEQTH